MPVTGAYILGRAATVLQDNEHVRWPLRELVGWINDGMLAIVLAKPSANPSSVVLNLIEGTLQALSDDTHLQLLRLMRNLTAAGPPRVGGRTIRPVTRDVLDASSPGWHDPTDYAYTDQVRSICFDEQNPREFYVFPGNTGSGLVEAVVSIAPTQLVADPPEAIDDIGSYDSQIGLREPWSIVVLDYVLFRAFSKDSETGDPQRAQAHFQSFAAAVGIKVQAEAQGNPNTAVKITKT